MYYTSYRRRKTPLRFFVLPFLFFPLAIFYQEIILRIACFSGDVSSNKLYVGLFSLSIGLAIMFIGRLFPTPVNRIISITLMALCTIFIGIQIVYFQVFTTFGTLYSFFTGFNAVTQFADATLAGIRDSLLYIILILLPLVVLIVFRKTLVPKTRLSLEFLGISLLAAVVSYGLAVFLISSNTDGIMPISYQYKEAFVPNLSVGNFGALTSLRLDAKFLIFGQPMGEGGKDPDHENTKQEFVKDPTIEYGYNMVEIDFDKLIENEKNPAIRDMHEYFRTIEPTKKNAYTGMFEGKNLIWLVGEAFSTLAINETTTPTLYKLAHEGFVFNNFYNPVWSVSTSDGEYVTMTGLIPKSGVWSFKRSGQNYMHYGFGNLLTPMGYTCKAYHNHYHTYYGRDISHPNLGYDYKGRGNGLNVKGTWPESDLEMMELTIPNDMKNQPFHNYYMTVSGHLNYTWFGNYMAKKHKEKVEHLNYSEPCLAYLACNIDLDLALEYVIDQLDAAGILDDTVIVLSGDHYPYGLTDEEMDELAGHELERKFEKFKSTLILWSSSMEEPVYVNKVCSSLDVMPTIANLLGIEYDSRFIIGQDILSPSPGLVELNDRSWISDLGKYDASKNEFTPKPGIFVDEEYAKKIYRRVNKSFEYSAKILDYDYYSKVFK